MIERDKLTAVGNARPVREKPPCSGGGRCVVVTT